MRLRVGQSVAVRANINGQMQWALGQYVRYDQRLQLHVAEELVPDSGKREY